MLQIAESLCKIDNKYSLIFGNMTNRQNDEKTKKIGGLRLYLADYTFYQNLPYKVH